MPPRIVIIDNYDSFTYNLVQYLCELGADCEVLLNDAIAVDALFEKKPDGILLSPGPCTPDDAGISLAVIAANKHVPLLGVCLGHQAIGQAFGGKVVRAGRLMHGKTSPIEHAQKGLFRGLPSPFEATRYHSLLVERASFPPSLEITAWTAEGEIMGLSHRALPIQGVQFHPESILTICGKDLLANWLSGVASA